jgi:CBS domain containing-hemolysin-like protein
MNFLPYIAIFFLILLSAFFSGSEIAYTSANKLRLKKLSESGKKSATLALKLSDDFDKLLSTILIGNNLVNIAASTVATAIAMASSIKSQELSALLATVIMTVVVLIFAETIPKIIGKKISVAVSCAAAYPLRILSFIFFPVVWLVTVIVRGISRLYKKDDTPLYTEDELVSIIETAEEEDIIDEDQSDLMQSAIEFSDISLSEILTPRTAMLAINIDDSPEEIQETIKNSHFSRLPVFEDSIDNIIGILYLNRFYKEFAVNEAPDLRELLIEPYFYHKTMKLPAVLADMKKRQAHIAVVVDEFGGTMGIVTLEDILEEIVGDIWDESDEIKEDFHSNPDGSVDVSGEMGIYDFLDEFEISDKDFESEYTTVAGWCIERLDGNPQEGDTFEFENLQIIISKMDDMRIENITVLIREKEVVE